MNEIAFQTQWILMETDKCIQNYVFGLLAERNNQINSNLILNSISSLLFPSELIYTEIHSFLVDVFSSIKNSMEALLKYLVIVQTKSLII